MKRRESRVGGAPTDLLVCFPSRAHLSLMPKPICSPSRPNEPPSKRNQHHHSRFNNRGQASPLFRTKPTNTKNPNNNNNKSMGNDISEPTSPKVTCAGQIKVRHKPNTCKNWQSVMEEIERIHNHQKQRKRPNWLDSFGFKKDVMQFLTALRGIRFDMRCFGSFNGSVDTDNSTDNDEDDEEDEEEEEDQQKKEVAVESSSGSRTIFSKWFMVLQENNDHSKSNGFNKKEDKEDNEGESVVAPAVPPSNALLLMRCSSAPAKGWLQEKEEEVEKKNLKQQFEEEKKNESLVLTSYAPDFFKVSTEIAKETWVVGSRDPLSRSRSWKR